MKIKFIAGPCVIESAELLDTVAQRLVAINERLGADIIFKASFDKANRTSISSFRGPGLEKGLRMLADVRAKWGLYPYEKARDAGASEIWLTERGNIYGYNNLVVDFRNIADMLRIAPTVVMDCTHSVQRPGAAGGKTGGNREFVPAMAQAAKAFGANGFFFEVHPDPDHAKSDGPNMLQLDELENLIKTLL